MGSLKSVLHVLRASRLYKRGKRLYYAKRYAEAIGPLQVAFSYVRDPLPSDDFWDAAAYGLHGTVRIHSVALLAYAAARQGDWALARSAIREGLPLFDEQKALFPARFAKDGFYTDWERWARSHVES
jgi:hypothetical protein